MKKETIAVIMTVHNRKNTTIECLRRLYMCPIPKNVEIFVYLMDDGSTDGTREAVLYEFPSVNVIQGNGKLYWNKGMRECWKEALKYKHDFFLWLNDDTYLYENAVEELYDVYKGLSPMSLVAGQLCSSANPKQQTYGGKFKGKVIVPTGNAEICDVACGNVLLIPKAVVDKIGILSKFYSHKWGDFDYSIRAISKGIGIYTTRCFIGTCDKNNVPRGKWCNSNFPLRKRIEYFFSPNGATPLEYAFYCFRTKTVKVALYNSILGNWHNFMKCLFPPKNDL